MIDIFRFTMFSLAGVILFFYLIRLSYLQWRSHQFYVVALHLAGSLWLGSILFDAAINWPRSLLWADIPGILVTVLWLLVSWKTWPNGRPPKYTESGAIPFDDEPIR